MALFEFDNVKAEKEDALWKYNMERKLRIGLSFIGFLFVLFSLSRSLIPQTVDFGRYFLSTFNKPLFTFILVNIIIVAVYVLSGQNNTHKQTASSDIYDEYVSSSRRRATPAPEETVVDKGIILVENAVTATLVSPVTETKRSVSQVKIQQKSTEENRTVTSKKEYRRSRSMASESRNKLAPEFRRSETVLLSRELVVIKGNEPPRKSMDEMSSEEFRSIIDSFIAEKKKTLIRENSVHYTTRNDNCMSIVVKN